MCYCEHSKSGEDWKRSYSCSCSGCTGFHKLKPCVEWEREYPPFNWLLWSSLRFGPIYPTAKFEKLQKFITQSPITKLSSLMGNYTKHVVIVLFPGPTHLSVATEQVYFVHKAWMSLPTCNQVFSTYDVLHGINFARLSPSIFCSCAGRAWNEANVDLYMSIHS